jgi:uncharacterized protein with FMN-binding domain
MPAAPARQQATSTPAAQASQAATSTPTAKAKASTKKLAATPSQTQAPAQTATPSQTPTPTPTKTATPASTNRTIAGSTVQTPFGPVQVQITVQGTKIISARALQTPQGGKSSWINQQAVPYLIQETLAAQSANIQGVGGATYTSASWAQSLQSALSQI